ncbi:polysaccharide deacetylase family protein [Acinetobacter sp. NIPH 2699]|uniref:polysaccharide deacetylase family protein n=1 Tax=Acinetobacter sp. NIPH 2699 TaxID=2923433 RepID=UPI001F4C0D2C|nr:polysaccharide deacetylase family protein [Acinetobacter sp. NIPH 2699]MCH7337758.1 polysaccharide deacetylase family protein [Acinetobacter sp. NIPH 2699]
MKKWLCLALFLMTTMSHAKQLALSFDDGVNPDLNVQANTINQHILEQLHQHQLKSIIYPSVIKIGDYAGLQLVAEWGKRGHNIGNHSELHLNLNKDHVTSQQYIDGIRRAEQVFQPLQGWVARYRYPFLKEGDTQEKRDMVADYLKQHHYQSGAVSIDASDWFYNQKYLSYQKQNQSLQLQKLKQAYIQHLLDRADYYDQLAVDTIGYSPKHVLLLHVNAINAAFLGDVIDAFQQQGWQWIDSEQAYTDPLYQRHATVLPAGESIVWSLAKQQGHTTLRYPAEDAPYEQDHLKRFDLP